MLKSNRLQNAWSVLQQINAWRLEEEAKEEKQRLLIQEKNRKEQEQEEFQVQELQTQPN